MRTTIIPRPGKGGSRLVFPFILLLLLIPCFLFTTDAIGQAKDACVGCHTDVAKMKALITKFPEIAAEEGEG